MKRNTFHVSRFTHHASRITDFIRLGRPHFLVGGFLFHGLGVVMALYAGASLDWMALLLGQAAVTSIQLMTHYSNDYFDLAADQANQTPTKWSGGSRILPEGRLSPQVALVAAISLATFAFVTIVGLAWFLRPLPVTLFMLLLALLLAWSYSAPPLRLHSRGLGELTTALLVPGLTPLVGFYLQAGWLGQGTGHSEGLATLPFLAVLPLCCLQFSMLLAINFPDAAGDALTGKRTLVVRLGAEKAAYLYNAVLLAAYAIVPLLLLVGLPSLVALAIYSTMPIALWQGWRVSRGAWREPAQWNSLAFWSVALLMGTATAELLAFLLLLR